MRDLRYGALSALLITAVSCGGSDPPGGGNGDTTDGGDGNIVNLVEAIPGWWREVRRDGMLVDPDRAYEASVRVDPNDPDCQQGLAQIWESGGFDGPPVAGGLPGDACISHLVVEPTVVILDGASVRIDLPPRTVPWVDGRDGPYTARGMVLDNGTRMEYRIEVMDSDPDRSTYAPRWELERCGSAGASHCSTPWPEQNCRCSWCRDMTGTRPDETLCEPWDEEDCERCY